MATRRPIRRSTFRASTRRISWRSWRGSAPLALKIVSQLRGMGREDLATYMETAIRGENLSDRMKAENPPPEEAPAAAPAEGAANSPQPASEKTDFLSDLSQWKANPQAKKPAEDRRDTFF